MGLVSSKREREAKFPTENFDFKVHVMVFEQILEGTTTKWEKTKHELESLISKKKMKRVEGSAEFLALKIELTRDKAKLRYLLEQTKSVKEVEKLESRSWQKRLRVNVKKAESILQEMSENEELEAPECEMQVEENIGKSELLLEEINLIKAIEKAESPMFQIQLNDLISKVESLLENAKLIREEGKTESPVLRMELKDLECLLQELILAQQTGQLQSLTIEMGMERLIMILKSMPEETEVEMAKLGSRTLIDKLIRSQELIFLLNKIPCHIFLMTHELKETINMSTAWQIHNMDWKESARILLQLKKHTVEFETLVREMKSVKVEAKLKFQMLKIELCIDTVELEPLLQKLKL